MKKYSVTVDGVESEMKIRDYLKRRLGFSTSLIAKVKCGNVILSGVPVHMRAMVKNGDVIDVFFPDEESECVEPIDIPLEVLYEDEAILLVNKPINMPIHPSRGNHLPTLANAVRAYLGAPFVFRCITRLDRDTSGIVLIAKDQLSAAMLSRELKAGGFTKKYVAEVVGVPEPHEGVINAPIERESEGEMKRVVREDGKPSITSYKVVSERGDESSTVEVIPITGRTHQIRVHMAYIGHPLVGDFLYGERTEGETYRLECRQLSFHHPISGKLMTVTLKTTKESQNDL